ncbi:MAG: 4Fe-4S dicluster domain-containing protein [Cellulosilyticum sp.]|nr:4Fe-4S dicluster domain-containing protein [Cellulosilyticum sp.]
MIGIYFSGTGNSKHCIETFLQAYSTQFKMPPLQSFSIESILADENQLLNQLARHDEIALCYPIQYSNLPKIVRDFIVGHAELWEGKRIFIIATMALFSGDGAGLAARLLKKYGAHIIGGLHLKMPDCIGDEKVLKRPLDINKKLVADAKNKINETVLALQKGNPPQEGLGLMYHLVGLFGQRLYFYNKTRHYTDKLKIDASKCIGCGKCATLCPMNNITLQNKIAFSSDQCTMCYRCVSNCPKEAITLLGKQVFEQSKIEKYL